MWVLGGGELTCFGAGVRVVGVVEVGAAALLLLVVAVRLPGAAGETRAGRASFLGGKVCRVVRRGRGCPVVLFTMHVGAGLFVNSLLLVE